MAAPSWQEQGSCREITNPKTGKPLPRNERMALFFPDDDQPVDELAVEACAFCPVLEQCRDWSVREQLFGYSGGMTERERGYARSYRGIWLSSGADDKHNKQSVWNVQSIPCPSARGYKMHLKRGHKVARVENGGCGCLEEHRKQSKASKDRARARRKAEAEAVSPA
jgi:hypothetical protein